MMMDVAVPEAGAENRLKGGLSQLLKYAFVGSALSHLSPWI